MSSLGFVTRITPPAGIPGAAVVLVSMYPMEIWPQFGGPAAIYSDNTVRNEAGTVLRDNRREYAGTRTATLSLGANMTSDDVARNLDGTPLAVKPSDPRDSFTAGGVTGDTAPVGELFVPGVGPYEAVYDDPKYGGWGTIVGEDFAPASQARRDDRWILPDGRIIDAQKTVLGRTSDRGQAARELLARGATPSIMWTGSQIIAAPINVQPSQMTTTVHSGGGTTTTDGTGRVIASTPPGGTDVQTLFSPAAPPPAGWNGTEDAAGSQAPIVIVPDRSVTLPATNQVTGYPSTDSTPGTGGGTTTAPISGVPVNAPPAMVTVQDGKLNLPEWAIWLAAGAALVWLMGRR